MVVRHPSVEPKLTWELPGPRIVAISTPSKVADQRRRRAGAHRRDADEAR